MKILITGGAGFAGSHLIEHLLAKTNWSIVSLDSYRHRGDSERHVKNDRVTYLQHDCSHPMSSRLIKKIGYVNFIAHLASDSHVDRSITDPVPFVENNIKVTLHMLEYARMIRGLQAFLQISTDEVYGAAPEGTKHAEWSPILPSNPYSASKAAQEAIAISYWRTYGVPIVITNCFSMDTRMFTEDGFKGYDEINVGDKVWTLDEKENLVLTDVLEKVKMPHAGKMVQFDSNKSNQLVTPNHRVMFRKPVGSPRRWGPIEEAPAETLVGLKNRIRIPTTGAWIGNNDHLSDYEIEGIDSFQLMELMGWFVSEGCILSSSTNGVAFASVKEEQCKEIKALLDLIGNSSYSSNSYRIYHKKLRSNCDTFGGIQINRFIPNWIKDLDSKHLRVFWETAMKGDGSTNDSHGVYYTSSYRLATDMCEVGMKIGYAVRVSERETWNPQKTEKNKSFIVRFRNPECDIEAKNISEVDYEGEVWCIKTKTGKVFVERNGIVELSGQTMNMVGEKQDEEKFVPMCIKKIRAGDTVTIHGNENYIGKRHYLHARNHADALLFLMLNHDPITYADNNTVVFPSRFNVVGDVEMDNLALAKMIADLMCRELKYELVDFHNSRPGHDRRYALDGAKIASLGWKAPISFEESLKRTIEWTIRNSEWL